MSDEEEQAGAAVGGSTDDRQGVIVIGGGETGADIVRRLAHVLAVTLVELEVEAPEVVRTTPNARFIKGDGTSMIVLKEAGVFEARTLIATTYNDDVNIEASRLAVQCGVPEVLCRLGEPSRVKEALAVGAVPLSAPAAMASAIVSRIPGVVVTTSQVGLGQGDILQVRVLAGSPVVGNEIKDIATREYLVAAVYREGDLIVPHGDTVIHAGDQVLLVGDPKTLGAVASYFRLGGAQFPHQFGQNVVIWADPGNTALLEEARWIREVTKTSGLMRVAMPDEPAATAEPWPLHLDPSGVRRDGSATPIGLEPVFESRPGLFVLAPPKRGVFKERGMAPLRSLLDQVQAPMLIARGTQPYERILVAVAESASSWRGLELAFDIARLLDSKVTAVHVSPPRFIGGERADEIARGVQSRVNELGRLYEVEIECLLVEGNPVREIEKLAADHELLVVARGLEQSDTYLAPDVGLRMVLGAPCSAILLTRD